MSHYQICEREELRRRKCDGRDVYDGTQLVVNASR